MTLLCKVYARINCRGFIVADADVSHDDKGSNQTHSRGLHLGPKRPVSRKLG